MNCPNCGKEMKKKTSFDGRSRIDWDGFDLEHVYMKVFKYSCKDCKIKYKEDEYSCTSFSVEPKWSIPKDLKPTEAQVKYAENIALELDLSTEDLHTKHQYWDFIKNHKAEYDKIYHYRYC